MDSASESAAPSETPYFFADLDLNRAVPRQFAVRPMDPEAYRVERYELTVPTGAPIALAHVLDGMQCVLYVGTDEAGCQYIAALELPGGVNRKLYTAEEGVAITSLARGENRGRWTDAAAFCWVETDGDRWRIRYNPDISGESFSPLDEHVYVKGALSQGSGFLPVFDHDPYGPSDCCALLSTQGEACLMLADGDMPLSVSLEPVCYQGQPVWDFRSTRFTCAEADPSRLDRLSVYLYEGDLATGALWDWLTYRMPEGEQLKCIVDAGVYNGSPTFALLSDKNRLYRIDEDHAEYHTVQEVGAVTRMHWGGEAYVSPDQAALYLWGREFDEEITLTDHPVRLTALAPGKTAPDPDAPEQLWAFAQEAGQCCVYAVSIPDYVKSDLYLYD